MLHGEQINAWELFLIYVNLSRLLLDGDYAIDLVATVVQRLLREGSLPLRVFAYDARGHGATTCADSKTLSAEVLTEDGIAIVQYIFNRVVEEELPSGGTRQGEPAKESVGTDGAADADSRSQRDPDSLPSVILVGHRFVPHPATLCSGRLVDYPRGPPMHFCAGLVCEGSLMQHGWSNCHEDGGIRACSAASWFNGVGCG